MNILETIIALKRKELVVRKKDFPFAELEKSRFMKRPKRSLQGSLLKNDSTGIIAEYKRRSPSKGVINNRDSIESVTRAYSAYGAAGISILTDLQYFGGSLDDLIAANDNGIPLLRKDFMIDPYQLVEAKAHGADVILLIAACLSQKEVKDLAGTAKSLDLEVLLEVHDESELGHVCEDVNMIGINNRDLKTFEVSLERSMQLSEKLGADKIKISESGIDSPETIRLLRNHGFSGFLIGEYFMKQKDPCTAFKNFTYSL